jgi:aminopeptidase
MNDPRIEQYAQLLVERSLNVQPKWQVVINATPLARPLVEAAVKHIAQRGAYALVRMNYADIAAAWLKHAPEELIAAPPPIEEFSMRQMDAYLGIHAPENTRDASDISPERHAAYSRSRQPYITRVMEGTLTWVGCNFPTHALAQDAGMTLEQYADFLYGACLLDWDALARTMRARADRFDRADDVHLVGEGTDLHFSLRNRNARVDDGHLNMPGGEFFYSPIEESAEGFITYSEYPAIYAGHAVEGVRLEFRDGRVVNASARTDEEFLIKTLDRGRAGAGRVGRRLQSGHSTPHARYVVRRKN